MELRLLNDGERLVLSKNVEVSTAQGGHSHSGHIVDTIQSTNCTVIPTCMAQIYQVGKYSELLGDRSIATRDD